MFIRFRNLHILAITLILVLFIYGCGSSSGSSDADASSSNDDENNGEEITLTLAGAHPTNDTFAQNLIEPFMERVTELTDGQVQFDYYPAEQLGSSQDLLQLTGDGVADIGYYASPYYPSNMPIGSNLIGIPQLIENTYVGSMAFHTVSLQEPVLSTDFLSNGVRPVATFVTPTNDFFTNGPEIILPEDLAGKNVRSPGGVFHEVLEFVDAVPVSVTTPESYEAFDRNIIDTLFSYASSLDNWGLGEVIEFGTSGVSYGAGSVGLMMNENVYQGLPSDIQEAIDQAGIEATQGNAEFYMQSDQEVIDEWIADGVVIHELSEEEKAEWARVAEEFTEYWLEVQDNEDLNTALEQLLEESEKHQE